MSAVLAGRARSAPLPQREHRQDGGQCDGSPSVARPGISSNGRGQPWSPQVGPPPHSQDLMNPVSPRPGFLRRPDASPSAGECTTKKLPPFLRISQRSSAPAKEHGRAVEGANADSVPKGKPQGSADGSKALPPLGLGGVLALPHRGPRGVRSGRGTTRRGERRPGPPRRARAGWDGKSGFTPRRQPSVVGTSPRCPSDDVRVDRRHSVARLPQGGPWLCAPALRVVCPCRAIVGSAEQYPGIGGRQIGPLNTCFAGPSLDLSVLFVGS